MMADPLSSWRAFEASKIPTKPALHPTFLSIINAAADGPDPTALLDLGCGDGRLTIDLVRLYHPFWV